MAVFNWFNKIGELQRFSQLNETDVVVELRFVIAFMIDQFFASSEVSVVFKTIGSPVDTEAAWLITLDAMGSCQDPSVRNDSTTTKVK